MFRNVKILPASQQDNSRKIVASGSDCEHEDREFIVDSGAFLHMSKNKLTSAEKDTIIRSSEPTS